MGRPVTLCTGQWADLPLRVLAEKAAAWGYDGLELACWGDHMDVFQAAESLDYCAAQKAILAEHGLELFAISNHLPGQLTLDPNTDSRSDAWAPKDCAGDPEKKRAWGIESIKTSARAAKNLGIEVVNGFSGSPIWHLLYSFPPVSEAMIQAGFNRFAEIWNPIFDVFDDCGVRFAYEVHPTELAFDIVTADRMLDAVGRRPALGFNFDPSHLHWQRVDPVLFLREFSDRIYHCHMKDAALQLDGRSGILGSHYNFGDPRRGWDFRSLGHGGVNFEEIIRTLNAIGYTGPLSVEWEDSGMEREHGARESRDFLRKIDFERSSRAFDAAFGDEA
ncbi:MAG: sugar phosphate isomerase/epimerase [Bryobacterales bacterium]|nr:sugar phosphate isomerase/epimerase [Bryobacterales bacterium]